MLWTPIADRWRRMQHDDSGFTLIEIMTTMFVISITLLGLMTVQVQSLRSIGLAKERQQATAMANRAIEQLRALPYDTVSAGLRSCDVTGDGNVSGSTFAPAYDSSISEPLVTNSNACSGASVAPLYPHIQNGAATKIGKVQYRVRTYVSAAGATVSKGYFLTVIADWSSGETQGVNKVIAVRSRLFSPSGCSSTSTATRPFAGPCQAFFYSDGGIAPAGITVKPVTDGNRLINTIDVSGLESTLPSLSARTQNEQVVSTQSVTSTSEATLTGASGKSVAGGQSGTSAADTDPASGTTNSPGSATTVSYSGSSSLSGSGNFGSFTASVPASASGSAYSTTAATATPACKDDVATTLVSNQACASGDVTPNGTYRAQMSLSPPGRNLGSATLASITTPSAGASAWRAFGARAALPVSGHCTGTSGIGCVAAGSRRSLGAMSVGGVPAIADGDVAPVGFTSMVTMDAFAATSYAEAGIAPGSPTATRTLTNLKYWNGVSYTTVSLAAGAGGSYPLGAASFVYAAGANAVQIDLSGTLTVDPASSTTTGSTPCQSAACSVTSTVGGVRVSVQYDVTYGGALVGSFLVKSNLGSTIAQTTYKAAPSA
ncbi:MAG: prepilin-type N-terminal cleavage/methylation domain-containing protein [Propionibacteriales bacterium]|nr:prepilin-type N-terminal cleavage/methylation domain-containing protein [Propionibacteriales bacterium]